MTPVLSLLCPSSYCLDDINLAQNSGYPRHLMYKLLQRKGKCLCEMFRFKEAEQVFDAARNALKESR